VTRTRRLLVIGFVLLVVSIVCGTTRNIGRTADAAQASVGMEIAVIPDQQQFTNPAVPVAAIRIVAGLSDPDADGKTQLLIKEVILENRSSKDVSSVIIRWVITPLNSRATTLARGEVSPHVLQALDKALRAGKRQILKLSHPQLSTLIQQIPNCEAMGNKFAFKIGVAKVVFEDGSSWEEELTDVSYKVPVSQTKIERLVFLKASHS
jgi:hypothetical protein